ncbi:MAG: threonine-phosphate decarboxylase CobD [Methanothrix sp.]|nr:threonine-phosphate decarboxylase CobD [Methanothrix sp.]
MRKSFALAEECRHGGRVHEAASILGAVPLDFSANINPLGFPPLDGLISEEIDQICHYPDNTYLRFRQAAARFVNVIPENIVPGNGSSELIRLFAETALEDGDLALVPFPTFGEYENQSLLAGARVRRIRIGEDGLLDLREPDLAEAKALFLCNPNNPTGRLLSRDAVEGIANRCEQAEVFLLVDEAFIELSDPSESIAEMAPGREGLFVMRSLTKSFGVPGLRLGFGVTDIQLARIMNRARVPWSISSIAASAGEYLLGCTDHLERSRRLIAEEREHLTEALRSLGLQPLESSVNFILVDIRPCGLTSDVLTERVMREGVLVRDCQSFGLGRGFIRVAVRSREENKRLISALERATACRG